MSRNKAYLSAVTFVLFFLALLNVSYASAEETTSRITKGVFIDEVEVSDMTVEEAEAAVEDFVEKLQGKQIAILVGEETLFTTLGDLGYNYEPNQYIQQALNLGTSGNLIKRYKDLKDIEQGSVVYPLSYTIDETKLTELIETKVSAFNIKPVNATVTRKNGKFIYTDHIMGSKVEVSQTVAKIMDIIFNNWNRMDIVVDAVMVEDLPLYTRDVVEKTNTILGSFATEYTSSAAGRAANLSNGARLINNTVLYPGETFSAYEYLTPFTVQNGYYQAGAYSQGKVIDSIGGGACQVTTTLYNAALKSELEIVERQAHSMTISYVDLSKDAAIAGTYKDLKFKNNTDAPILIEAVTKDRRITFNIWGYESRDTENRRVEYKTVVLSETPAPADVVTKDPTKPITYRKVTQSAHTGYKSELYKIIYENDVEVSRELVNKSNYAAAPRYVTIGTKVEEKPVEKPEDPKNENKIPEETTETTPNVPDTNPTNENEEDSLESQASTNQNRTNPEGQLQGDFYWDTAWDEEDSID